MAPKPAEQSEFTAKSVEEALAMAAESLGIPEFRLDYQVVRDNSRTLFGLVRTGEVTIRVTVPLERPQPSVSDVVSRLLSNTGPEPAEDDDDWGEDEDEEEEWVDEEDLAEEEQVEEAEEYVDEEEEPADEDEGDDWGDDEEDEDESRSAAPSLRQSADDSLEAVATEVIATLLDKMGILAAVEISDPGSESGGDESSPMVLNLVGDDLGILIGRRGETLRDLQFITRLIVSRRMGEWPNLVVDVEGYKSRRTRALRSLARRMADQVRRTHQPVVLEPMPANERRIVHLALRDDVDVYTESTGQDEARKVQILPKRER